jgi:mono/diheme cytochrome c family protein
VWFMARRRGRRGLGSNALGCAPSGEGSKESFWRATEQGEKVAKTDCASCHGLKGQGEVQSESDGEIF